MTKILKSLMITTVLLIMLATPALAASWSMVMKYSVVDGYNNGQVYNLNSGNRTVTGNLWASYWNNNLTNKVNVYVALYKYNRWLPDSNITNASYNVNKGGSYTPINLSASNQSEGTYYLYFSKANNETTVNGSGIIK